MATATGAPASAGVDSGVSPSGGEALAARHAPPNRRVLLRLDSRASRLVVLALTLVGATWLAKAIASAAIADYLARGPVVLSQLERALAWDPDNPALHLRLVEAHLGELDGADAGRVRVHLEVALRQQPTHAATWLQIALFADRQGDRAQRRQALETAVRLDPHSVQLRWDAALLNLRWGDRDGALEHLRYVLAVDPAQRDAAFQLARTLLGPREPIASLLPPEADALTGVLAAAVEHEDALLARVAWERRATLVPPLPMDLQRRYMDLLLKEGEGPAARQLWLALGPSGRPAAPGNAVWNGSFESDALLGWGLDWQIQRTWGVEVALDRFAAAQGRQSLRLAFNSFPTLDFAGVFQMVAVDPGREYRLRALTKAVNFTTRSGLKLQVVAPDWEQVLAETPTVAGTTSGWVPLESRVQIPAGVSLVRVRLRREKAPDPEGNLGGKVWFDDVSLTPVGKSQERDRPGAERPPA